MAPAVPPVASEAVIVPVPPAATAVEPVRLDSDRPPTGVAEPLMFTR